MWLDRLSAHSTPSDSPPPPTNKPLLPSSSWKVPSQVPYSSQRPGFSPRSSSLSIKAHDSPKILKTHGLEQRSTDRALDSSNTLDVLERLLVTVAKGPSFPTMPGIVVNGMPAAGPSEFDVELDVEFEGLSLRAFVLMGPFVPDLEPSHNGQSVEEYMRDNDKYEDIHRSIHACDEVLNSVEVNLTNFQNDLASVSAEIETLQARSGTLTSRMDNRKLIESGLGPIVEEISLSPGVVKKIVDGSIDDAWVKALAEVEKRSKALETKSSDQRNIRGLTDLKPLLENLIIKALERIRDFMVQQVKALRSPNINAQIIQQQHFLRYKDLYGFLHKHHPQLAEEIAKAYMNTMRWYFSNHFNRYAKAIESVKVHIFDKHDVFGQEEGSRKLINLAGAKASSASPHDVSILGRRIDLLRTNNHSALSSFLAEEDKTTHYLEFPFRNFNLALVDNASAECSFLTSFFSPALPYSAIFRYFTYVFEPVLALGQTLTKTLASETYDCLGLLLCVRLNQRFAFQLQRRKMPAIDGYVNATNMLLWPRFQIIMDAHCESVRNLTNALPIKKSSSSEQAKQSAAPHLLTQRFGQFIHGILALSAEAGDDEPVSASLMRLRSEVEAFLTKNSKMIGDERKRERFLYNNYSLVLTIIGDLEGKLAREQVAHFEQLRKAYDGA